MSAETISFQISGLTDYNLNFGWHDRHFMQPFFETFFFHCAIMTQIMTRDCDDSHNTVGYHVFIHNWCQILYWIAFEISYRHLQFDEIFSLQMRVFKSVFFFFPLFFSKSVDLSKSIYIFWNIDYCWIFLDIYDEKSSFS